MSYAIYIASAAGAIALLMMLPRKGFTYRKLGALVGAGALGGIWLVLADDLPETLGISQAAMVYYYIFSALAIGSAVRVITHTKPVYSALWFVMVVLATAGLFLILSAEFMAAAMAIIYGGAILVTYVFVIMLASEAGDSSNDESSPEYERVAREPFAAVVAGFLLLALIASIAFEPIDRERTVADYQQEEAALLAETLTDRTTAGDGPIAEYYKEVQNETTVPDIVADADSMTNVEHVGYDLFNKHPLGIELAGVILLVSLIGAVVIARKRVEDVTETAHG